MIPLTYEENKSYICHICEEKFCIDKDDENYENKRKVKDMQEKLEELLIVNAT